MKYKFKENPDSITYKVDNQKITKEDVFVNFNFLIDDKLLLFWNTFEHILFDNGISIYGFELAKERNVQYEISIYLKDYILVGDDGSGQGIFLNKLNLENSIYYLDLGAIGSMELYKIEKSFFEWLEKDISIDILTDEKDDLLFEKATLYIKNELINPNEKTKLIFNLRKQLELSESVSEISKGINENNVYKIKSDFLPFKYINSIKEIQLKYGCLQLISKNKNKEITLN